jgi:hypothetical protein
MQRRAIVAILSVLLSCGSQTAEIAACEAILADVARAAVAASYTPGG